MVSQKPLTPEEFEELYSRVPRISVDLVVQTDEGIIFTLRALPTWNGMWHLPGSTVRYGETIAQAVERTAHDELGISVQVEKLLGYLEYPSEKKERGFGWTISLVFLCRVKGGALKKSDDEASQIKAFGALPDPLIREQQDFLLSHTEWQSGTT